MNFIQIGNDPEATEALQALDDDLKTTYNVKRDMFVAIVFLPCFVSSYISIIRVDTTPYSGSLNANFILKALCKSPAA